MPSLRHACAVVCAVAVLCAASGCGASSSPPAASSLDTREVRLPDGTRILSEVKVTPDDRARGMMFRDSLAADRGMLFVHELPGNYAYWMKNCRIGLDIIWMDGGRRVVEISPDTPPCRSDVDAQCPSYGGKEVSQFVLELQAGSAARHNLKPGDRIEF